MTSRTAPAGEVLHTEARLVAVYDLFNAGDRDFAFYASRIGTARQRILDLGCGTGTFAPARVRARTSRENLPGFLFMAPFSQESRPPQNPVRFNRQSALSPPASSLVH